jgi:acetoin utilization deacetylase AcuC-like enzyme
MVYHEGYDLHLGEHVFPSKKYKWLHDRLLRTHFAAPEDFAAPEPATDDDVRLVHDPAWVAKLRTGTLTYQDILRLEIPYSRQMVEAFWLAAGGTILAARLALRDRIGFNIGGGFHHAFPAHGEGFCAIHDFAIAIRRLQRDGVLQRAMVVDCDVHHGNGTAAIFAADPSVFTLSIHQFNNYPSEKPPSSLDIHMPDGAGDDEYLHRLANGYRAALLMFQPELLVYVAGARRPARARPAGDLDGAHAQSPSGHRAGRRLRAERGRHHHHPRQYRSGG